MNSKKRQIIEKRKQNAPCSPSNMVLARIRLAIMPANKTYIELTKKDFIMGKVLSLFFLKSRYKELAIMI